MWVVYEKDTGWTEEDMRFADIEDAGQWVLDTGDEWLYAIRYEN